MVDVVTTNISMLQFLSTLIHTLPAQRSYESFVIPFRFSDDGCRITVQRADRVVLIDTLLPVDFFSSYRVPSPVSFSIPLFGFHRMITRVASGSDSLRIKLKRGMCSFFVQHSNESTIAYKTLATVVETVPPTIPSVIRKDAILYLDQAVLENAVQAFTRMHIPKTTFNIRDRVLKLVGENLGFNIQQAVLTLGSDGVKSAKPCHATFETAFLASFLVNVPFITTSIILTQDGPAFFEWQVYSGYIHLFIAELNP